MNYLRLIFLSLIILTASCTATSVSEQLEDLNIIDWHVHVAGLGHKGSGCFINDEMRENFRFRYFMTWMDVTLEELETQGDQIVVKKLNDKIEQSQYIDAAIVLALDGVIDPDTKRLDKKKTQFYVPNEHVAKETAKYPRLLFGASINPNREDAIERLVEVDRQGAYLIKWIPSIMHIDPSDKHFIPFYKKMMELNMPLLTHTGMEKSFSSARDELADPHKLILPLSLGVTVIAAHIATTGESGGQDNFERILPMFEQYPNLYADISSLTQLNKLGYLARALKHPGLTGRMIYGTDWPLQYFPLVSPWYHINHIGFKNAWKISGIKNAWDRDVKLKEAIGVPHSVFSNKPGKFIDP